MLITSSDRDKNATQNLNVSNSMADFALNGTRVGLFDPTALSYLYENGINYNTTSPHVRHLDLSSRRGSNGSVNSNGSVRFMPAAPTTNRQHVVRHIHRQKSVANSNTRNITLPHAQTASNSTNCARLSYCHASTHNRLSSKHTDDCRDVLTQDPLNMERFQIKESAPSTYVANWNVPMAMTTSTSVSQSTTDLENTLIHNRSSSTLSIGNSRTMSQPSCHTQPESTVVTDGSTAAISAGHDGTKTAVMTTDSESDTDGAINKLLKKYSNLKQEKKRRSRKHKRSAAKARHRNVKSIGSSNGTLHIANANQMHNQTNCSQLQIQATHIVHTAPVHNNIAKQLVPQSASLFEQSTMQYVAQQKKFIRRLPKMAESFVGEKASTVIPLTDSPSRSWHEGSPRKSHDGSPVRHVTKGLCRVIKVYLSERQSAMITDMGRDIPCAPPATPTPELLQRYEYVASLNDVKSQRAVKVRLEILDREEKKRAQKLKETKQRHDKQHERDQERDKRHKQRQQIYALNKVMTELEQSNFLNFCKANGVDPN